MLHHPFSIMQKHLQSSLLIILFLTFALYFFASTLRSDSDSFYEKSRSFSYFNSDGLKEFSYEHQSKNNALVNPNSPEYIEQLKQNITNLENQLKWVSIVSDEKETKLTKARNLLGEVWSQEIVKDKKERDEKSFSDGLKVISSFPYTSSKKHNLPWLVLISLKYTEIIKGPES